MKHTPYEHIPCTHRLKTHFSNKVKIGLMNSVPKVNAIVSIYFIYHSRQQQQKNQVQHIKILHRNKNASSKSNAHRPNNKLSAAFYTDIDYTYNTKYACKKALWQRPKRHIRVRVRESTQLQKTFHFFPLYSCCLSIVFVLAGSFHSIALARSLCSL